MSRIPLLIGNIWRIVAASRSISRAAPLLVAILYQRHSGLAPRINNGGDFQRASSQQVNIQDGVEGRQHINYCEDSLRDFSRSKNRSMNLVSKTPAPEVFIRKNALMQRNRGVNSFHDKHAQRALHASHRFCAVRSMHNQFRDQRIVIRRHNTFRVLRRVNAHAVAAGQVKDGDLSGRWSEFFRVLGIDAALDGVTAHLDRLW